MLRRFFASKPAETPTDTDVLALLATLPQFSIARAAAPAAQKGA